MSCDNQVAFHCFTANIVVAVVAMYGVRWLAWLSKGYNYQLSSIIAESRRAVVRLASVACVVRELYACCECSTQQEHQEVR